MLSSCDQSFSFLARELRSDVKFRHPLILCFFSSHRRANTGLKHVVRVSNHIQNKTKKRGEKNQVGTKIKEKDEWRSSSSVLPEELVMQRMDGCRMGFTSS